MIAAIAAALGWSMFRFYAMLAAVAAIIAAVTAGALWFYTAGFNAAELKQLRADKAALERSVEVNRKLAEQDRVAEVENEKKIQELESYVEQLQDRDSECLSAADVKRLQDVIGR